MTVIPALLWRCFYRRFINHQPSTGINGYMNPQFRFLLPVKLERIFVYIWTGTGLDYVLSNTDKTICLGAILKVVKRTAGSDIYLHVWKISGIILFGKQLRRRSNHPSFHGCPRN